MSDAKERSWTVRIYWKDARGVFESGACTRFPDSMGALEVVQEVARWRGVDLSRATAIDATSSDD